MLHWTIIITDNFAVGDCVFVLYSRDSFCLCAGYLKTFQL